MKRPAALEPQLTQFGLTEADFDRYRAELSRYESRKNKTASVFELVGASVPPIVLAVVLWRRTGEIIPAFIGLFFGCLASGISASIGRFFGELVGERLIGRPAMPDNQVRYKQARERWALDVQRWEREKWLEEEREQRKRARFWLNLNGSQFEKETASLFEKIGFEARILGGSGDRGVDIELRRGGSLTVVQCKARKKPLGPAVVRELLGAKVDRKAVAAVLVTLRGVTSGGRSFAKENSIKVLDVRDLVSLAKELE